TYFFTTCSQYVLRRRAEKEGTLLPMRLKGFPVVNWAAMILLVAIVVLGMFAPDVRAQLMSTGGLVVILYVIGMGWSRHAGRSPFHPTTD
ncbi:amino acid transporter, partial [Cutibacterium acnes]